MKRELIAVMHSPKDNVYEVAGFDAGTDMVHCRSRHGAEWDEPRAMIIAAGYKFTKAYRVTADDGRVSYESLEGHTIGTRNASYQ